MPSVNYELPYDGFSGIIPSENPSYGNVNYLSKKAGHTVRKRGRYPRRADPDQLLIKSDIGILSKHYTGLSQSDRDLWSAYGDLEERVDVLGNPYTLSGIAAHNWTNWYRLIAGETLLDQPPPRRDDLTLSPILTVGILAPPNPPGISIGAQADLPTNLATIYLRVSAPLPPGHVIGDYRDILLPWSPRSGCMAFFLSQRHAWWTTPTAPYDVTKPTVYERTAITDDWYPGPPALTPRYYPGI